MFRFILSGNWTFWEKILNPQAETLKGLCNFTGKYKTMIKDYTEFTFSFLTAKILCYTPRVLNIILGWIVTLSLFDHRPE